MKSSSTFPALAMALSKFQGAVSAVPKNAKGHGYNYTTLGDLVSAIRQPMADNELSYVQLPSTTESGQVALETVLMHSSGEWISTIMSAGAVEGKRMNDVQGMGAAITYLRRYSLAAILGIPFGDDTDGVTPPAPKPTRQPRKQPQGLDKPAPSPRAVLADHIKRVFGASAKDAAGMYLSAVYNVSKTDELSGEQIKEWSTQLSSMSPKTEDEIKAFFKSIEETTEDEEGAE